MMSKTWRRATLAAGAVAMAAGPLATSIASAQSNYPPPPSYGGYNGQGYSGQGYSGQNGTPQQQGDAYDSRPYGSTGDYDHRDDPRGYDQGPPPANLPPPPGYDGRDLPPPPPGYQAQNADQWRDADRRYAEDAERWARENCVKSRGDATAGAVIGGIFGAIIGNGLSSRHDGSFGTFAGAAVGAAGGAAIASSAGSNETSPGCPPGYSVRRGATYVYSQPGYYYAAPGWYRPWVYVGTEWVYRPYPYHDWYWRTYRSHGYYGGYRGGYRGYYGGHHGYRRGW